MDYRLPLVSEDGSPDIESAKTNKTKINKKNHNGIETYKRENESKT